ncbi:MAG: carbohydrate ABC transporter permease [Spirochaetales bacterium]|nr:carbohydrate ABC transporter permease [Spirochaetales bacterium]
MRIEKTTSFDIVNYIFMVLFALSIIYPLWSLFVISFSDPLDVMGLDIHIFPKNFTIQSYQLIFSNDNIFYAYFNTTLRTVCGTVLSLAVTACAAYSLSSKRLPFRSLITFFFIFTMFFSGGLIPTYLLIRRLGLVDNRLALIIPTAANVFNIVIIRNYIMASVSDTLKESAQIDGANHFTVLWKIVLPMCKPVLATVSLWLMVGHWNAWFDAMIYINSSSKQVLQILLRKIMFTYSEPSIQSAQVALGLEVNKVNPETLKAAFVFVTIGPIILVYPYIQKYFVKGLVIGSLKG